MGKTVLFEGLLLIVISVVGIVEGIRLVICRPPHVLEDPLGPGFYIVLISLGMMASGVADLFAQYNTSGKIEKDSISLEMKIKVMSMVGVFVIYLLLISTVGYGVATFVFFFLESIIVTVVSLKLRRWVPEGVLDDTSDK